MSPRWKDSIQIAHSSLPKYFCPPPLRLCACDLALEPLASALAGSFSRFAREGLMAPRFGVEICAGVINGGGGIVLLVGDGESGTKWIEECAECVECAEWWLEIECRSASCSLSVSFSHTISGDQTRSGREKTTSAGARSASRTLISASIIRFENKEGGKKGREGKRREEKGREGGKHRERGEREEGMRRQNSPCQSDAMSCNRSQEENSRHE